MARDTGTLALSTTPAQLPNQPCIEIALSNPDATIAMLIGWTQAKQTFTLPPGAAIVLQAGNANQVWAKSASGTPTLNYITS